MASSRAIIGLFGLPGQWEVVIILLVVLLLFGGRKLPELARGLARGLRIFRDEMRGIKTDIEQEQEPPQDDESQQSGTDRDKQDQQ